MTAPVHFSAPPRPGIVLIGVVVSLLLAAAAIAYVGTRDRAATEPEAVIAEPPDTGPIVRIELPRVSFPIPYGEHQESFQRACTQCHSPRLAFTQPRFPAKKWGEVVTKMVNAHKAAITAEEQSRIVAYLVSVHGE